jgi:hypothetical protein
MTVLIIIGLYLAKVIFYSFHCLFSYCFSNGNYIAQGHEKERVLFMMMQGGLVGEYVYQIFLIEYNHSGFYIKVGEIYIVISRCDFI